MNRINNTSFFLVNVSSGLVRDVLPLYCSLTLYQGFSKGMRCSQVGTQRGVFSVKMVSKRERGGAPVEYLNGRSCCYCPSGIILI